MAPDHPAESRDHQGLLVLPLTDDDETTYLRWAGDLLERNVGATALDRFQAPDQKFWDYRVRGVIVALHWVQHSGLSIMATDKEPATEAQARELAVSLRAQLAAYKASDTR